MPSNSKQRNGTTATSTLDQIPELVESLRQAFNSGRTRPLEWRREQLKGILRMLGERQSDLLDALRQDLGKPRLDALASEVLATELETLHALKNLKKWTRPEKVGTPFLAQPGRSSIIKDPLGVVLVIAPWNYPVLLTLAPIVCALAAGNTVVLKPSEVAPATSAALARLLPEFLDPSCVKVVEGAVPETTKLLEQKFDHILYTGNGTVGRIVMKAAAEHLTPVTLELGGKSPCIVDDTADLKTSAKRIIWGKFFNCGQTCVAPDYVLVEESLEREFTHLLSAQVKSFFGDDPQRSKQYGRIINQRHYRRLMELLDGGGRTVVGGAGDEQDCYLAPTLLTEVPKDAPVMKDEIFGPILPIIPVKDVKEAVSFINSRPKPLALYLFSQDGETQDYVLGNTSSGGAMVNHCLYHSSSPELPFGGVGESGMGAYHGRAGFDTFTHRKGVMRKPFALDVPLLYPPYAKRLGRLVEPLLKVWRKVRPIR